LTFWAGLNAAAKAVTDHPINDWRFWRLAGHGEQ
jgi:hypothetical protein